MKVSVIIPTYNEENSILDCLESLGKQTYSDFEIIVIDDGSTDKTGQYLKNTSKLIPQIRLVTQNHKGAGSARNLGANKAKGEILVFVDADMTFDQEFLAKLIKPILEGKAIGTFSKDESLANKDNLWAVCWNINRGLPKYKMHPDNYPDTQKVFRAILKKNFEASGGFDEKGGYIDDYLSDRVGSRAQVAPGAIFFHKNPETLKEVFDQSKWMAKRKYKLGFVGTLIAMARVSLPISIFSGVIISITNVMPGFFIFKIVSDFGCLMGIMEYTFKGKVAK
ncbi:glycosyltransferase family 2 protein [Candidatus Microgenomates bacterium]|nr:glycosyltransferase family 2 protein [Candidatus Microgenomates bacterium]